MIWEVKKESREIKKGRWLHSFCPGQKREENFHLQMNPHLEEAHNLTELRPAASASFSSAQPESYHPSVSVISAVALLCFATIRWVSFACSAYFPHRLSLEGCTARSNPGLLSSPAPSKSRSFAQSVLGVRFEAGMREEAGWYRR